MKLRKGFTLVELLIVIVIIGILAAAMLLSSGSATDSAEASNIVTNLRGLKAAGLMLFADSMDVFTDSNDADPTPAEALEAIKDYMDRPDAIDADYGVIINGSQMWIGYNAATKSQGIRDKLAARQVALGLVTGTVGNTIPTQNYTGAGWVFMPAR